jgi:hypothetical protein
MAWPKRKADPISDRARALNQEIAGLESQIRKLDAELQRNQSRARAKPSSTLPSATLPTTASDDVASKAPMPESQEPIFERVDQNRLKAREEAEHSADHFNDLGVRKYDLPALFQRIRNHFRGPSTTNPKLVSYLAAGGIQGLRPLRYEKRVARNRFIALAALLFAILLGTVLVFYRPR